MKIRKQYVLYINEMLCTAYYGTDKFNKRISNATFGLVYDCTFSELMTNLRILKNKNYTINRRKY